MTMTSRHSQHGAVLIVSLLILLVLTIVGVSGLNNTSMEERMSHNFQHAMLAFQGAESANEVIIERSNLANDTANNPLLMAVTAGLDDTSTVVDQDMDPDNFLGGASLATSSTVSWKGKTSGDLCAGESAGSQDCDQFALTTTATIAETGTTTTHLQGVELVVPHSGS